MAVKHAHRPFSFFFPFGSCEGFDMFEKWTKKAATKATDGAVEGVKESLNEKLETYSGIIKIGLTIGVIIFGSVKINDHRERRQDQQRLMSGYSPPYRSDYGQGQHPIIINNYITDGRHPYGGQKQNRPKHKEGR